MTFKSNLTAGFQEINAGTCQQARDGGRIALTVRPAVRSGHRRKYHIIARASGALRSAGRFVGE